MPRQRPHPATTAKLQRWIDLVAELLSRGAPATFEQLAEAVPEYHGKLRAARALPDEARRATAIATLKRTFERDKDELRRLGIVLQVLPDGDNNDATYRLRANDFYLPYLCLVGSPGAAAPRRTDRWGYRALATLHFSPDELQAVVDAAALVGTLGDPLLRAASASAMRKLAMDLPVDGIRTRPDEPRLALPRARASTATFEALGDALRRRKTVTFSYDAPGAPHTPREVEPYGLFFLSGHWYLAAHDRTRRARRNFRLNRITGAAVNTARPATADYEIPTDFDVRDLARSRHAWELGDGDGEPAIVEVRGSTGPDLAALQLGEPVEGEASRRSFMVRRREPFVRWILSFAGGVVPVTPPGVVAACVMMLEQARARYARDPLPVAESQGESVAAAPPRTTTAPAVSDAASQFRRILALVPLIADGHPQPLQAVAERIGTTVDVLRDDLYSLVERFDVPGGFVEGVQLFIESDRVSATTNHFHRPMRLTAPELCALELGLAMLQARRPPDEHAPLRAARERLRAVIAKLPDDPLPAMLRDVAVGELTVATAHVTALRGAILDRRKVRLRYRRSGGTSASERVVHPRGLVAASGMLYLVAWDEGANDLRIFRLDRMEQVTRLEESFDANGGEDLDLWIDSGRAFRAEGAETMHVWYSAQVAPWIAEREGRALAGDGTLVVEHRVADREWALRHVLQYGDGAELLAPQELRAALRERLVAMIGALT